MLIMRLIWLPLLVFAACETESKLTLVFGGDVMLDRGIRIQIKQNGAEHLTQDITSIFRNADFAIVNLECPVTSVHTPLTKKFVFRAEPEWLPALRTAGITHCILANNHSYDHGRDGLTATAENLNDADIVPVGYGTSQHVACLPTLIEKNGISVALFSSVTLNLESWMYLENAPGMCQATIDDLKQSITRHRKDHPETTIIITLHWGVEYQFTPSAFQRQQALELIEAGADAIIGHHPHVVQSFERIEGKPVFYSIGNLIFDNPNPATHEGILVKFILTKNENAVEIVPYRSARSIPLLMTESEKYNWVQKFQGISDPLPIVP